MHCIWICICRILRVCTNWFSIINHKCSIRNCWQRFPMFWAQPYIDTHFLINTLQSMQKSSPTTNWKAFNFETSDKFHESTVSRRHTSIRIVIWMITPIFSINLVYSKRTSMFRTNWHCVIYKNVFPLYNQVSLMHYNIVIFQFRNRLKYGLISCWESVAKVTQLGVHL